jgi:hypothetical protein
LDLKIQQRIIGVALLQNVNNIVTENLATQAQSLDLVSQLDHVFATPVPLSAKPDRAFLPSFNSKDEMGETACHMYGKSFKGISIHKTAYRKRMEKTCYFV